MKTTININGKAVEIDLTPEQVEAIKKDYEKITDRVKTFEDALEIVGSSENLNILLAYNGQDIDVLASVAHAKLSIIAKALNEGWKPNWSDTNEYKYYPWFYQAGSVAGFSDSGYGYDDDYSNVGARLVFKSRELAEYAGRQFISLYKDMMALE